MIVFDVVFTDGSSRPGDVVLVFSPGTHGPQAQIARVVPPRPIKSIIFSYNVQGVQGVVAFEDVSVTMIRPAMTVVMRATD